MIISAHQPAYLPWLGYLYKIIQSDVFIYLDNVQFEKNSFTNRNKIKTPQGEVWLTIPVKTKGHFSKTLIEIQIDNTQDWRKKHLNTIFMNYKRAPRFEECFSKLEMLYQKKYDYIAELCLDHLLFWCQEIDISTKIVRSSKLPIKAKKSDLILNLCRHFQASHYVSGALGANYLQENDFKKTGISINYQNYKHPVYPQLWGEFLPYLSIIDFWMNTGNYKLIILNGDNA